MSTSISGWASRSFIIGIRLCPPATSRVSGPCRASSAMACSTLVARWYSNWAGTCMTLPRLGGPSWAGPSGPDKAS